MTSCFDAVQLSWNLEDEMFIRSTSFQRSCRPPSGTPGQNGFGTIGLQWPNNQNLGLCHRDKTCLYRGKKIVSGNFSSYWPFLGVTRKKICFFVNKQFDWYGIQNVWLCHWDKTFLSLGKLFLRKSFICFEHFVSVTCAKNLKFSTTCEPHLIRRLADLALKV